jgi:hypothetical protein
MTLTQRVLALYRAEVQRTGNYLAARQAVIKQFRLTPAAADRILRAGSGR